MFVRIDHVEIVPEDFDRSLAFYRDILGFRLVRRQELSEGPLKAIAYLQLGDGVVELMRVDKPGPLPENPTVGYRAIALEVEDMDAAVFYLRARGVPPTWGPIEIDGSVRAEVNDPDGNVIELREWKQRPW